MSINTPASNSAEPRSITIEPPLLNSANPWATTLEDLDSLYRCPSTGAITTRTALLEGFAHDDAIHQYTFFDAQMNPNSGQKANGNATGSLNTLGYSPFPLSSYLSMVHQLDQKYSQQVTPHPKPIILSVTGSPSEVRRCHALIAETQRDVSIPLLMEINLSCPNIAGKPPPAYSAASLKTYLDDLQDISAIPIGLKTPPYTYSEQFDSLVGALRNSAKTCRVSFITATNTLGSSLVLERGPSQSDADGWTKAINSSTGSGIGGLAGAPLHALALGNVKTLRGMLDQHPQLRHVQIIGVGGVSDADGYLRMRSVGASAVAVGTALGQRGVGVFDEISKGLEEKVGEGMLEKSLTRTSRI
jgi:dihydroorotate dehydrogenase (fumarate)